MNDQSDGGRFWAKYFEFTSGLADRGAKFCQACMTDLLADAVGRAAFLYFIRYGRTRWLPRGMGPDTLGKPRAPQDMTRASA
jgi:hypothetical protein